MDTPAGASGRPDTRPLTKPKIRLVKPLNRESVEIKPSSSIATLVPPQSPPPIPLTPLVHPTDVFGPDFADAEIIYDRLENNYYAFGTNTIGQNVQRLVSKDQTHWKRLSDALPVLPSDAIAGGTWAPTVRFDVQNRNWVMTVAYRSRSTGFERLAVATAPSPDATFVARSKPLVANSNVHVIDPDVINIAGLPYLVRVDAIPGVGNRIVAQQETSDELAVQGEAFVLAAAPAILEGPTVVTDGDTAILVFADGRTGDWKQSGYSTFYVEGSIDDVFLKRKGFDLSQARPLMTSVWGGPLATGEPAVALDPVTGDFASTAGVLSFYTNGLKTESFFGSQYEARHLYRYQVRIGDGSRRAGGPVLPPSLMEPTQGAKPRPKPTPTRPPVPTSIATPSPRPRPAPSSTPPHTPRPTPSPTVSPSPTPSSTPTVVPSASPSPTASVSPAPTPRPTD